MDRGEPADEPAVGGREFIDWLVEADLFVVALDRDGVWYRFHHLFQDLLRHEFDKRFSTADESDIHRRASEWCAEHGLFDDAIGHAVKVRDDFETARNLVARWGYQLIEQERWRALFGWLALLPREMVDNDLDLLTLEMWALGAGTNQFDHMMTAIDRAEALIEADPPSPDVLDRTVGCIETMRGVRGLDHRSGGPRCRTVAARGRVAARRRTPQLGMGGTRAHPGIARVGRPTRGA